MSWLTYEPSRTFTLNEIKPYPRVRTFHGRRSRMTPTQRSALERLGGQLVSLVDQPVDVEKLFGQAAPLVLDIGCGMGESTIVQAVAQPEINLLAIDVHTPGLGNLLAAQEREGVTNLRLMQADAVEVLDRMIPTGSLRGARIYFPDPWPKPRHRKRRLIQPEFVALLVSRIEDNGFIHCATDDLNYGKQMLDVFAGVPGLVNVYDGFAPKPKERPQTKFERRAVRAGRSVVDVCVTRRLHS